MRKPGAILVWSEDAYRQVSGRLDMAVADLGPTQLARTIERPIRVYFAHCKCGARRPSQLHTDAKPAPAAKPPVA